MGDGRGRVEAAPVTSSSMLIFCRLALPTMFTMGDEFPRRLCDSLLPVTAVLYCHWLAAGLHDIIISQGVGGHRVFVGIRHPLHMRNRRGYPRCSAA